MTDYELSFQRLKEEISRLKVEVAELEILQKEKDRLEQEYNNSQRNFKTVFEQSSLGHKFIDSDLKIIKVNKALVEMLGYSVKELTGSLITALVEPEFAESWKKLQRELWTNKKSSCSIDTCLVRKNKSILWCHVTSILLDDNGERLAYTILEDISERKSLENDLKEAHNRERLFEQQLLELTVGTQEKERARIADDLHNSLGQLLYGAKLSLDHVQSADSAHQEQNALTLKNTKDLLAECIKETRRIAHDLMPVVLEDFGLKEAIQDICSQLNRTMSFKCVFTGLYQRLPKYLEIAIYRIVQELAMNLVKHAGATRASLKLAVHKKDIFINVEDNGKGFPTLKLKENEGMGIRSIKTRLHLLKGELDVSSSPEKGTIINIRIPCKGNSEQG
jgi:PAS domain S-box-containing protein